MLDKKKTIIIIIVIIVVGFVISNVLSNQKQPLHRKHSSKIETEIKTLKIKTEDIVTEIKAGGRLTAYYKIELFAEVTGVLENHTKRFEEGRAFNKGETMIHIDDQVFRNNLLAQKSSLLNQMTLMLPDLRIDFPEAAKRWEKFLSEFELEKKLSPLPRQESDQEKYYIASRNIFNLYYSVKSMEATLDKYRLNAPFKGEVTSSNIKPGTLIRAGQKIGEFMNVSLFELKVPFGLKDVQYIHIGNNVRLTSSDISGEFEGKVTRINKAIDTNTQTVMVYINTTDQRLKDGMYLTAHVLTRKVENTALIPRYLLNNKNQLYVVENSKIIQKQVKVVNNDGDNVIVTGLNEGEYILNQEYDESMSSNQ